mgnify:CR=1 FL=1
MADNSAHDSDAILAAARASLNNQRAGGRRVAGRPIGQRSAALRRSVSAMRQAGPGTDAFIEHDLHFHTLLAGATGNPLHGVLVGALHALLARSIRGGLPHYADPAHFGALISVHDRLAQAVETQASTHGYADLRWRALVF